MLLSSLPSPTLSPSSPSPLPPLPVQRLLRHDVVHAGQALQLGERGQGVEVGEVPQGVVRQHKRREVGRELLQVRADSGDSVVGEEERAEASEAREAVEGEDAIVGEVDRVELVLLLGFWVFAEEEVEGRSR